MLPKSVKNNQNFKNFRLRRATVTLVRIQYNAIENLKINSLQTSDLVSYKLQV